MEQQYFSSQVNLCTMFTLHILISMPIPIDQQAQLKINAFKKLEACLELTSPSNYHLFSRFPFKSQYRHAFSCGSLYYAPQMSCFLHIKGKTLQKKNTTHFIAVVWSQTLSIFEYAFISQQLIAAFISSLPHLSSAHFCQAIFPCQKALTKITSFFFFF